MTRTDILEKLFHSGLLDRFDGRSGREGERGGASLSDDYDSRRFDDWIAGMKQHCKWPQLMIAEYSFLAGNLDEVIFPTEFESLDEKGREMVEMLRVEWEDRRDYARYLCQCWEIPFPKPFGMGLNRQLHLLGQEQGEDFFDEKGEIAHPERIGQEPMTRVEYIQYNQELPCRCQIIAGEVRYLSRKVLWGRRYIAPGSEKWQQLVFDMRRLAEARAEQIYFSNYWFHEDPPALEAEIEIQLSGRKIILR